MRRAFRTLAIATTASTVLLIAWGGVVRATGSGDGCPDWPTCFGSWVPRVEYHTLIEYFHRLLAVGLAPLFVIQAAIGGWIIATHEDPAVVTLHFAVAFVVLGVAVAITVLALPLEPGGLRSYARITAMTALATYALLLVGTYVRAEGADSRSMTGR